MTLAVDISNYSTPLTPEALAAWKDQGVGLVIVQAINPPRPYPPTQTRQQIQACVDAGLAVDAYVWLWFDASLSDIYAKLALLKGLPIRQLWLDVEDTAALKYSFDVCRNKVYDALKACDAFPTTSGQRTGIYSGRWFWSGSYMGNITDFADRELWDSNYDEQPDTDVNFRPYGGWTSARIKQYRGTTTLSGVGNVDMNVLSVAEAAEIEEEITVRIPQEYVDKFSLASDQDIDGLIANFEGVVSESNRQGQLKALDYVRQFAIETAANT